MRFQNLCNLCNLWILVSGRSNAQIDWRLHGLARVSNNLRSDISRRDGRQDATGGDDNVSPDEKALGGVHRLRVGTDCCFCYWRGGGWLRRKLSSARMD